MLVAELLLTVEAERYAAGAAVVALAAVDQAQEAALEAWLARREADSAQGSRAA